MSPTVRPNLLARAAGAALAGIAAVVSALSISICSAAPELVWQGLVLAAHHITWIDLLSALLIGLVLAFLVDPLMERIRHALSHHRPHTAHADGGERNPLFSTCIGIAFAFVSVCLHSALTSFVAGPNGHSEADLAVLESALTLTAAWAFVPFFVTLAWLGVHSRWAKIPLGIVAGASSWLAGWLFAWDWQAIVITAVPCVAILLLGYRQTATGSSTSSFAPYIRSLVLVALAWLAFTVLIEVAAYFTGRDPLRLNDDLEFWIDARFYFGWALGLLLTPFPFHHSCTGHRR